MRVEFTAFAADSIIGGTLDCQGARLSDYLSADPEFEIRDVVLTALDDGRTLRVDAVRMSRDDFAAITSTGPRGMAALRSRTRPFPVRTRLGPYDIVGYLHLPPGTHAFTGPVRRTIVPLTSARIRYRLGAIRVERSCDALLLNGDGIIWVTPATNMDLAIGDVIDVPARFGRPKDMTGGVSH